MADDQKKLEENSKSTQNETEKDSSFFDEETRKEIKEIMEKYPNHSLEIRGDKIIVTNKISGAVMEISL